ncbi:MAG: MarP family serine protease [Acidimicrobiales bacterium]
MNLLDLVVLALAVASGVVGYQLGFLRRISTWIGAAAGLLVAVLLLPEIAELYDDSSNFTVLMLMLGVVVATTTAGELVGVLVGNSLRLVLPPPFRLVDRAVGALAGVAVVAFVLWLLLPTMARTPTWPAEQARGSVVASVVQDVLPDAPDAIDGIRAVVGDDGFPDVLSGLTAAPSTADPPTTSGVLQPVRELVAPSIVKVVSEGCSRVQQGTGFIAEAGIVVTNAHVVAGGDRVDVVSDEFGEIRAQVVVFDPVTDLAVLSVPALVGRPLPLADGVEGSEGAVFGHPGGGVLELSPFRIESTIDARGGDVYGSADVVRRIHVLAARLEGGDSGGPLVGPDGSVVGVAFAIAPDASDVAYGVRTESVRAILAAPRGEALVTACVQ